ncbi:hypothetical protein RCL_jg6689.t1 [Rhizophagus clarus]|uniref:Uncharacterized protein n=1 Tax=Rhizophagus clarus TaxID=94130 RepID=A0A8H3LC93_9GLOM|nr:hypothetical protein RCL_jg6689.t1 [Rhizophagus clarus]
MYTQNIKDYDYDKKDPLFESSICKENSNIAESTEGRNEVTHENIPKRIMSNEEEKEGDLEYDLDVFKSNTMTKNTDVDDDEQDFGNQKIIPKTNKKVKSNIDDDDDSGSDKLHLEPQTCQLLLVIYKDILKRIMKKKVNNKKEEKDDNVK